MDNWCFFPSDENVFADQARDYFVPLASVDLGLLCPGHEGPVHFLRPRMCKDGQTAKQLGETLYPEGWYAFRRDTKGRYQTNEPLVGELDIESGDPYDTAYAGNSKTRFEKGEIGLAELLRYADLSGEWPNANWNDGKTAQKLVARDLRYLGEIDTINFCKAGCCGSVLLMDEEDETIFQVFHWT